MRLHCLIPLLCWFVAAAPAAAQVPPVVSPVPPPMGAPVSAPPQTAAPLGTAPAGTPAPAVPTLPAPGALPPGPLPFTGKTSSSLNPLTLPEALALAARASDTVRAAGVIAGAQRAAAAAPTLAAPTLDASAGVAPSEGQPSRLESGALLTFPLALPGERLAARAARAAALAGDAQATATLAVSSQATAQGVVGAFFAVAADQAQRRAARQSLRLAARSLAAARARHDVGAAPRLDVVRARSAWETAQAALAAATAALAGDRRALGRWLGQGNVGRVAAPALPAALPDDAATLGGLSDIPQAQASAAQSAEASAALGVAQASLRPQAALGAGIETRGATVGPALVLTFSLPLDTRLLQAQVQAARAARAAAQAGETQALREVTAQYLTARAQAQAALARLPDLQSADRDAQEVAAADLAAYRLGAVPSSELILAQQQAAATRSALVGAQTQAGQAVALLQTYFTIPAGGQR